MASLETKYLGLSLKSPVIVGSSPLTQNVVSLEKCEEAGAGAVVSNLFSKNKLIMKSAKRSRRMKNILISHLLITSIEGLQLIFILINI